MNKFSKRETCEFNSYRVFMQWLVCSYVICGYLKMKYDFKIEGLENVPENSRFIAAANHISNNDPFIVAGSLKQPIAFMAKEELFENWFTSWVMDVCGAFAVRRGKVAVSTIKTALSLNETKWMLGLFPQGTRDPSDNTGKITKGFATFAKATKADILPIGIVGSDQKSRWPFCKKIRVKVGKIIPYSDDIDGMIKEWCNVVSEMTGKGYELSET